MDKSAKRLSQTHARNPTHAQRSPQPYARGRSQDVALADQMDSDQSLYHCDELQYTIDIQGALIVGAADGR